MAVLAHALQMVGGWIPPLVLLVVKRDSRFVSFHALQALLLQLVYFFVLMLLMLVWFVLIFSQVLSSRGAQHPNGPPVAIFIAFPLIGLGWMVAWVGMLVIVILYSIKAGRGEWAGYPLLGALSRKILGIDQTAVSSTLSPPAS